MCELITSLFGKRLAILSTILKTDCTTLYSAFYSNKDILKVAIEEYEIFAIQEINSVFEQSNKFSDIVINHLRNFHCFMEQFRQDYQIGNMNNNNSNGIDDQLIDVIIIMLKEWYLQSDKGHQFQLMIEIDAFNLSRHERGNQFFTTIPIVNHDGNQSQQKYGRIKLLNEPHSFILTFRNNKVFDCDSTTVKRAKLIQEQRKYKSNATIDLIPEKCSFMIIPKMLYGLNIDTKQCRSSIAIHGIEFTADGFSNINAKNNAGRKALKYFCNYETEERKRFQTLPLEFGDKIEEMVYKMTETISSFNVKNRKSVISAIVQTQYYDMSTCRIITIASGTKNIDGDHISQSTVNDTHAEIVARRCFMKYLNDQLVLAMDKNGKQNSIFIEQSNDITPYFKLRDGIKFHLYISRGPCGDATAFYAKNNTEIGKLRAKIEKREGYIVVDSIKASTQSKESIHQGIPLYTATCSDKIARWNIVGVQGALLSQLIKPIYFDSIIIKSHKNYEDSVSRAFYGRIENHVNSLPSDYRLNKPNILYVSNNYNRNTHDADPPEWSSNWIVGHNGFVELIISKTGVLKNFRVSRIAKKSLMAQFVKIIHDKFGRDAIKSKYVYHDLKLIGTSYQTAKDKCIEAFRQAGLGSWEKVQKPPETDRFHL